MSNDYAGRLLTAGHSNNGVHYQIREYGFDDSQLKNSYTVFGRFETPPSHIVEEYLDTFERFLSGSNELEMYLEGWIDITIVDDVKMARDTAEELDPQFVADKWHEAFARILVNHVGDVT